MKDGSKLLPLVTSFTLQSLDLFKHYDLILASKKWVHFEMLTLIIDIPLSNFNSKLWHVLQNLLSFQHAFRSCQALSEQKIPSSIC